MLVILAILAAMMVPALLGYIDEARNKQYVLEARSIYMAAQAVADKEYGKGTAGDSLAELLKGTDEYSAVESLSDIEEITSITITQKNGDPLADGKLDPADKSTYVINGMTIEFKSKGKPISATLKDGEWTAAPKAGQE